MPDQFASKFVITARSNPVPQPWLDQRLLSSNGYADFAARYAGCTFNSGLYRFHDAKSGPAGMMLLRTAFPEVPGSAVPFAFDWVGDQFLVDANRLLGDQPQVFLAELGTGKVLALPHTFADFHEKLPEVAESALGESFFLSWQERYPEPISFDSCASYKKPLFVGGSDSLDNLELSSFEVYWHLIGQLRAYVRTLPDGGRITRIEKSGR
jgi:hypothetical protein